jgi:hypothetical protein
MPRAQHILPYQVAWSTEGAYVPAAQWARRQPIPGAVIPSEKGPIDPGQLSAAKPDLYQVAVDYSATTPTGGWATGVTITYQAGGHSFSSTVYYGLALSAWPERPTSNCALFTKKIQAAFAHA